MKRFCALALAVGTLGAADVLNIFGREWTVPVAADWKVDREGGAEVLRLAQNRGPLPGPRRPIQFALTDIGESWRTTIELDMKPLGQSLLVVFAYHDPAHFDYAHLSTDAGEKQPLHNGIFHVYGGERVRISSPKGLSSFATSDRWYHVKLTHDAATSTVEVEVDGRAIPALRAVDHNLGPGKVGIGSFDETGEFKNVRITTAASR